MFIKVWIFNNFLIKHVKLKICFAQLCSKELVWFAQVHMYINMYVYMYTYTYIQITFTYGDNGQHLAMLVGCHMDFPTK